MLLSVVVRKYRTLKRIWSLRLVRITIVTVVCILKYRTLRENLSTRLVTVILDVVMIF
jgi:hypothetical protein